MVLLGGCCDDKCGHTGNTLVSLGRVTPVTPMQSVQVPAGARRPLWGRAGCGTAAACGAAPPSSVPVTRAGQRQLLQEHEGRRRMGLTPPGVKTDLPGASWNCDQGWKHLQV